MSSDGTFKSNDQIMSQVKLKFIDTKSSHTTDFQTVFSSLNQSSCCFCFFIDSFGYLCNFTNACQLRVSYLL